MQTDDGFMKLRMTENTEREKKRLECLDYLRKHRVNVGLTSSASDRSRTLLAIHEHGSPAMHLPARPVVRPALAQEGVRKEMASCQAEALKAALAGDLEGTRAALEQSGQAGADGIRAYIDKGVPSASLMVVAPHCGGNSLSLDLTPDEVFRHRRPSGVRPPNAPVTLQGGWMRNPVSGKPVKVKGKSGTTSATSKVVTPHRGDHSLSVDLTSFENSAAGGRKEVRPLVDTGQLYDDFGWEIR
jgi:hypothetical protein